MFFMFSNVVKADVSPKASGLKTSSFGKYFL